MKTSILTSLALRSLVRSTSVVGGLALLAIPALGMMAMSPRPPMSSRGAVALERDAPMDPGCYYGSAFNSGVVVLDRAQTEGRPVHFKQRYLHTDGCTWEVDETLVPQGALYSYSYDEHVVSCEVGATPARACELHGVVTVHSLP
jgi:hypothetical protein